MVFLAPERKILQAPSGPPVPAVERTSLEEERREVFESILESMRMPDLDADRAAACTYLFQHLNRPAVPC